METAPPYKSGNVVVAAALSIALLLGAGAYRLGIAQGVTPRNTPEKQALVSVRDTTPADIPDTDHDGYPDWQELLTGSDPQDPEETPQTMRARASAASGDETAVGEMYTVTEEVAQRLITETLSIARSGLIERTTAQRAGEAIAQDIRIPVPFEPYALSDVLRAPKGTSAKAYRSAMQTAAEPLLGLSAPEFEIYARALETGDTEYLTALIEAADVYHKTAERIMAVPVPEDAREVHVEAANSLAYFGAVLENLVHYINDPLASLALLRSYNEAEEYMRSIFTLLGSYYASN